MLAVSQVPESIGYYFAGFVDGEGSFNLSFRKRKDYKQPWKVSLCLNVSQKDQVILALLKHHLKCGTIRYKCDDVWFFEVNNLTAIHENVIPFFDRFGLGCRADSEHIDAGLEARELVLREPERPGRGCEHERGQRWVVGFLSAKKKRDFAIFKQMAALMAGKAHLNKEGIVELLELRREMNDGGKRKYTEGEILAIFDGPVSSETTCQTSDDDSSGDDIVRSAERFAEQGRNDPAGQEGESHSD